MMIDNLLSTSAVAQAASLAEVHPMDQGNIEYFSPTTFHPDPTTQPMKDCSVLPLRLVVILWVIVTEEWQAILTTTDVVLNTALATIGLSEPGLHALMAEGIGTNALDSLLLHLFLTGGSGNAGRDRTGGRGRGKVGGRGETGGAGLGGNTLSLRSGGGSGGWRGTGRSAARGGGLCVPLLALSAQDDGSPGSNALGGFFELLLRFLPLLPTILLSNVVGPADRDDVHEQFLVLAHLDGGRIAVIPLLIVIALLIALITLVGLVVFVVIGHIDRFPEARKKRASGNDRSSFEGNKAIAKERLGFS
ncbi:hypothetical protein PG996_005117 [Apiospora saccharicola]|uniref:Uncharacterized protein n=1 Tax=Apiospora saccharicola TaxID=335842 RepID=A0ABR1VKK2_9PEZI